MSNFTAEQKSQLAKLMANENLTVQHQKIKTARFDPKNRVLYLPIWQNMTGSIYDLLCGHEVGHALYTPAEGWHDAVTDKSKPKNYKGFLNVVEDARIEKKVKRKYPGLKSQFLNAYNELIARDFFGLKGRDISELCFVDRLNLYTKSQYTMPIKFTADEQKLVDKVVSCESWDDVVKATDAVYAYSADEQYEMMLEDFESFASFEPDDDGDYEFDDEDEFSDSSDSESSPTGDESPESESSDSPSESQKEADEDNDGDGNGEKTDAENKSKSNGEENNTDAGEESTNEDDGNSINRFKDSAPATKDMFSPKCETDNSFRENEDQLLDETCKEYVYIDVPTANLENIVTPAKRVQELLTIYYDAAMNDGSLSEEKVKTWVSEFKTKNERYVSLLAKEFEMRKAAKSFSKSKLSDTGDIDINKLASYRFDDNIFRKMMVVPKGKSHGLVLLLDCSGSMSDNMSGSLEQIMVLAMFCRKVNIPFSVYGFSDDTSVRLIDLGKTSYEDRISYSHKQYPCFSSEVGEMELGYLQLREYLNSRMSNAEFSKAMRNLVLLKKSYETNGRYWRAEVGRPESESLTNTPMMQAIVACGSIMKTFRKVNNLDMSSLVIVHDGDADRCNYYCTMEEYTDYHTGAKSMRKNFRGFNINSQNVILQDKKNKFQHKLEYKPSTEPMLIALLEWFRKTTQSKVFGFFLISNRSGYAKNAIYNRYVFDDGSNLQSKRDKGDWSIYERQKTLLKELRSEKFLVSNNQGYNSFYLVAGGSDLITENEEIEIDGKVTANKLKNAFMKFNKKKAINRVLVSKFIQGIAA